MAPSARSSHGSRRSSSPSLAPTGASKARSLNPFWKEKETLTDEAVLKQVHSRDTQSATDEPVSPSDDPSHTDYGTWESPPNPLCPASFGDKGMTATVNAYGLLMQFGDYLGTGRSGMFSADHGSVSQPWFVISRAEDLHKMAKEPTVRSESYGLFLRGLNLQTERPPRLRWRHWRWPCYEYGSEHFFDNSTTFNVQWMVHKKTLLQQCVLESNDPRELSIEIGFLKSMRICELDHVDDNSQFNASSNDQFWSGPGPGNYTWIWQARYPYAKAGEDGQEATDRPEQTKPESAEANETNEKAVGQGPDGENIPHDEAERETDAQQRQTDMRFGYFQHEPTRVPKILITEAPTIENLKQPADDTKTSKDGTPKEPGSVAVIAAVFVNGVPRKFSSEQDYSSPQAWTENLLERARDSSSKPKRLEIVTAYRMVQLPLTNANWQDMVISARDVDIDSFMNEGSCLTRRTSSADLIGTPQTPFGNLVDQVSGHQDRLGVQGSNTETETASGSSSKQYQFKDPLGVPGNSSPSDHIGFVMWRNLEHILSVCSVPVGSPAESKGDVGIQPIAITCGDMSTHRICNSASFFAFQFLIKAAKLLRGLDNKSAAINTLQDRIKKVCVGHIKWLAVAEMSGSHCFAANYWVTGRIYPDEEESLSWLASDGASDTPLQIIKAAEASKFYRRDETVQSLCDDFLRQIRDPWFERLRKLDQRIKFAWPHAMEEGINTFRLDDHVWIWRAMKALDDLNMWDNWTYGSHKKEYSITDIQREVLQRFTTKNEDSGKRMLAVTRSVREHRFLFHARDTALFYGQELDFFLKSTSFHELWKDTIQAQVHHEDNHEIVWDNAIRYALTIVMGTRGFRINSSKDVPDLVRNAAAVLFSSASPNGIFPGQLDEVKEGNPVLFDEERHRDFYFHAHFEICYILLLNFDEICEVYHGKTTRTQKESESSQSKLIPEEPRPAPPLRLGQVVDYELEITPSNLANLPEGTLVAQDRQLGIVKVQEVAMKKSFPFGRLIDSSKIMDIDEEWLFNYPTFLEEREVPLPGFSQIQQLILVEAEKAEANGSVISQQMEAYRDGKPINDQNPVDSFVAMIDVPKRKHVGRGKNRQDVGPRFLLSRERLWDNLKANRTAEKAKKRLIWLYRPKTEAAVMCYLTASSAYKVPMSLFFDRHAKQETYFSDETSKVHNVWNTELLFSFYVLTGREKEHQQPDNLRSTAPDFPTIQGSIPTRTCLGFHFDGDIFDRYWTCHYIDFGYTIYEERYSRVSASLEKERDWRQRKVLELLFLKRMLDSTLRSTKILIDKLKHEMDEGEDSFAQLSSERYLATTHTRLQGLRKLFEAIDASLADIVGVMNRWGARENDRAQQPRWTRNDEKKYRESISTLQGSIERQFMVLKAMHPNVRSLKEELSATLSTNVAKIMEKRNLHESENMRLFTYVTVVFLPLGFAASIFSMAGAPDTPLLVDMIVCAIISLVLTVVTLMNAKRLAGMAQTASRAIHNYSSGMMEQHLIASYHGSNHSNMNFNDISEAGDLESDEKSWHVWFWVTYLVIKFPARRVIVACRIMGFLNHNGQDHSRERESMVSAQSDKEGQERSFIRTIATTLVSFGWEAVQIFAGLVFAPLFLTSWVLQIIFYNMLDLIRHVGRTVFSLTSPLAATPNHIDEAYPDLWTKPGKLWRPLKDDQVSENTEATSGKEMEAIGGEYTRKEKKKDVSV